MNMPPAARKGYMAFLLLAVGLYVSFLAYRGVTEWQKYNERTAISANDQSDLMIPLANAVNTYTAAHGGQLPKAVSIADLLSQSKISATYLPKVADNPDARLYWNAALDSLRQADGRRTIVLWLDDAGHRHYIAALTTDGSTCIPEIILRTELHDLKGVGAKLK